MEKFIVIAVVLVLFFVVSIIIIYVRTQRQEAKKQISNFICFIDDAKKELDFASFAGTLDPSDNLKKRSEERFQNLIKYLYYFPKENDSLYYKDHENNFMIKVCSSLRYYFKSYKKGGRKDIEKITSNFYKEIEG